jgi:virginiamycin B lyase
MAAWMAACAKKPNQLASSNVNEYSIASSPPSDTAAAQQAASDPTAAAEVAAVRADKEEAREPITVNIGAAGLGTLGQVGETIAPTGVPSGVAPTGVETEVPGNNPPTGSPTEACPLSSYASLPVSVGPVYLAASADKKIYFSDYAGDQVGSMDISTSTPTFVTGNLATDDGPADLIIGPDGKIWVDEFGLMGAVQESVDEFTLPGGTLDVSMSNPLPAPDKLAAPDGITLGPDGNVWITENAASAIRSLTAEGLFGNDNPTTTANAMPTGIVVGTDNNLWFAETTGNAIAQYNFGDGKVHEFPLPTACSAPTRLVVGNDGNLWFTEVGTSKIGEMAMVASTGVTVGQVLNEYSIQTGAVPTGITVGPDCKIWFSEAGTDSIGILDPSDGSLNESTTLTGGASPSDLKLGADGNMYVAETGRDQIARIIPAVGSSTSCSVPVFPAVASCISSLAVNTDPNQCYATITTAELDDGSTDPNVSPAGAPAETIGPGGTTSVMLPPAKNPQNVPLLARPEARPPNSATAPPLPVAACNVPVTVTDNQPPTITCPASQTVQCTSPAGATVPFAPTATDNCTVQSVTCTPVVSAAPGSTTFAIGQTTESCVATDNSGNQSTPCLSTVTVTDNVPPVISSIVASPNVMPPQGKRVAINLAVADSAPCDPAPPVCQVTGIQNAINGKITGPLSISMSEDPVIILLPRIVTINVQCTDNAGNSSSGKVKVEVKGLLQILLSLL